MRWGKTISKRRLRSKIAEALDAPGTKIAISATLNVPVWAVCKIIRGADTAAEYFDAVALHYGYRPSGSEMYVAVEKQGVA